jgi:hypothetical protein
MSRTCLHCWHHVQRLRVHGKVPCTSGSRGLVPGILRSLLSLCCSNSRRGYVSPVDWDWQVLPVRLCECEPCQTPPVKSRGHHGSGEIPAKIAAFRTREMSRRLASPPSPHPRHSGAGRNLYPLWTKTPAFAGVTERGGYGCCKRPSAFHVSQALSRIQYFFTSTACWLGARTGTFPPFLSQPP